MFTLMIILVVVGTILLFLSVLGMAWCNFSDFPNLKIAWVIVIMSFLGMVLTLIGNSYFIGLTY
jgi:hypothetical protein